MEDETSNDVEAVEYIEDEEDPDGGESKYWHVLVVFFLDVTLSTNWDKQKHNHVII